MNEMSKLIEMNDKDQLKIDQRIVKIGQRIDRTRNNLIGFLCESCRQSIPGTGRTQEAQCLKK